MAPPPRNTDNPNLEYIPVPRAVFDWALRKLPAVITGLAAGGFTATMMFTDGRAAAPQPTNIVLTTEQMDQVREKLIDDKFVDQVAAAIASRPLNQMQLGQITAVLQASNEANNALLLREVSLMIREDNTTSGPSRAPETVPSTRRH